MKEDTAKLFNGSNELNSPCLVFYVSSNCIEKKAVEIDGSDERLITHEQNDEGFLTWIFYDEWKDAKIEVPEHPFEYTSAAGLLAQSTMRLPKSVRERIERGIFTLPDVKEYLKGRKGD